jgi:hypothetical protein
VIADLAVDEDKVAAQMAVAEVLLTTPKRMIEEAARERGISGEHLDDAFEQAVEIPAVDALPLALVVATKAAGLLNRPH